MQIKSQNKGAFEEGGNYAKELEMVVARERQEEFKEKQRYYKR